MRGFGLDAILAERDFRQLIGAQFLAQGADGLAQAVVADLLVLEPLTRGTPERILGLFVVTLLPYSIISPFLGVFVDRWARRSLLAWTNFARAAVLISYPLWSRAFPGDSPLFIAILALLGLGRLFLTTKGAALPAVLHEHHLLDGNSLSGGGGMVAALLGGVMGIALLGVMDAPEAFVVAGIVYAGAAALSLRISTPLSHPHARAERVTQAVARIAGELVDGLSAIWGHVAARLPLIGIFVLRTVGIFLAISAILVIKDEFTGDVGRFGRLSSSALALGAAGIGAFIGALTTPLVGRRLSNPGLIVLGFVASGLGIIALGGIRNIPAVLGVTLVGGYGGFMSKVATDAQVQEALPDQYRGRAFALYDILYNLASVAAGIAMVALYSPATLRLLLVCVGGFTIAAAAALGAAMHQARMPLTV
jgi:MFS family permease